MAATSSGVNSISAAAKFARRVTLARRLRDRHDRFFRGRPRDRDRLGRRVVGLCDLDHGVDPLTRPPANGE